MITKKYVAIYDLTNIWGKPVLHAGDVVEAWVDADYTNVVFVLSAEGIHTVNIIYLREYHAPKPMTNEDTTMKWDIYEVDILSVNSADDIVIGEANAPTGWVARVALDELSLTDEERANITAFIAQAETLGAG